MKALFIEEFALRYLVANREFQSGEFDKAIQLVNAIRKSLAVNIDSLRLQISKDIGYLYCSKNTNVNNAIIFDFAYLEEFTNRDNDDFITIFQKVLKCTLKSWEKLSFNNATEKNIGNNHIIVFPLPYTNENPYKVFLNFAPDSAYTTRRNMSYMYVANAGYGSFPQEYQIINLKPIKDEASRICVAESLHNPHAESQCVDALTVTELDEISDVKDCYINYETWLHLLTQKQKNFVTKELLGNERLEGAAGTGKSLTLVLRAVFLYNMYKSLGKEFHLIFIAHSIATKRQLEGMFQTHYPEQAVYDRTHSMQSITITTLQEWCTEYLGDRIGRSEIIDTDAQETKENQLLFLKEIYSESLSNDYPTYKCKCSEEFIHFIESTNIDLIIELLQSEISVTIKGRAGEDLDIYKKLPRLECSMPIKESGDFNFVFLIFEKYQKTLLDFGYFDNDDISLSAKGQLNTPIWRRRRKELGYDVIIIDESHLFSYNELAIFHHLSKDNSLTKIIYAIDKTQAIGERGLTKKSIENSLKIATNNEDDVKYNTVFRSSPQIINLAFSVLTSGVNMFTNFENPLEKVNFSFVNDEELRSSTPEYILKASDADMIGSVFHIAEELSQKLECPKNKILIVCTTLELLDQLEKNANSLHKPFEILKRRGDMEVVKSAEKNKRYVIGYIDYIGGLEFDGVIILGVDKGRVPPMDALEKSSYQSYAWHNRMYVAITRAKYSIIILGDKTRTMSPMLDNAIKENKIILSEILS